MNDNKYTDAVSISGPSSTKWPAGKIPWWIREAFSKAGSFEPEPALQGQKEVDVAIVGGGLTGLWTALAIHRKRPDIRIAILEAEFCGSGASGMNGGFVHGYWDALPRLLRDFGESDAMSMAEAGSIAQENISDFCAASGPDADFRAAARVKIATSPDQRNRLREYLKISEKYKLNDKIRHVSQSEIQKFCFLPAYGDGLCFLENATVQPAKLVKALKEAVLGMGIEIYEMSRVETFRKTRGLHVIHTPGGCLLAGDVILATNASSPGFGKFFKRKLTNFSSYVLVTNSIPEKLKSIGWTSDISFSTAKMFLNWFRKTADDRIIFGTGGGPIGYDGAFNGRLLSHRRTYKKLIADFLRMFPVCSADDVACTWAGAVDLSADRLPFFGTIPGTRIHYGCGYSGHGVNATWIGGQILSELALNTERVWSKLPFHTRTIADWPPEPFRYLGGNLFHAGLMSHEDAIEVGTKPSIFATMVNRLPKVGAAKLGAR